MKCPNDQTTLVMSERSGIEIDYCPECRGVWLDRGELDKIVERAGATPAASSPPVTPGAPARGYDGSGSGYGDRSSGSGYDDRGYDDRRTGQPYDHAYGKRRKKDNWLSELFD